MVCKQLLPTTPAMQRILRHRRFGLKFLFAVSTLVAIGAYLFRPPIMSASVSVESLRISRFDEEEFLLATCRLVNTAPNSLWFVGIDDEPIYDFRVPINGKWEDRSHYWCSQQRVMELPEGESIAFEAICHSPEEGIQIGIGFSTSPKFDEITVLWSNRKLRKPSTN